MTVGPARAGDTITQVSILEALLAGDYAGRLSLRQLLAYGNFGLGTFNRLDGEMILLEGKFFQVKVNGQAGGHVLGFTLKEGRAALDLCRRFLLVLPEDGRPRQRNVKTALPTQPPGKVE